MLARQLMAKPARLLKIRLCMVSQINDSCSYGTQELMISRLNFYFTFCFAYYFNSKTSEPQLSSAEKNVYKSIKSLQDMWDQLISESKKLFIVE